MTVCCFDDSASLSLVRMPNQVVSDAEGKALAEEYHIKFYETSAKNDVNVVEAFTSIAKDIKRRLMDNPNANQQKQGLVLPSDPNNKGEKKGCCKGGS